MKVEEILSKVQQLPPFPQVALKVLEMVGREAPFKEIARVIELDEGFTAEILKICNSPFFGLSRKISSVQEAVVYLGEKYLLEIVTRTASKKYFEAAHRGYDLQRGELWRHAVACAVASDLLQERLGRGKDLALFTASLLHDIGKVVLSSYVADGLKEILERVRAGKPFIEAEKEVIGMDHATLGGMIAKRWNFPEEIIDAILYHHNPKEAKTEYAAKVHIADVLCSTLGIGAGNDELSEKIDSEVLKGLGLSGKDLMEMLVELQDRYEKTQSLFTTEQGDGF
ncbi:MAG: HDOD domain-containing protein [Deltaproteobacteria bacterium]|nr:MAG: HDOD domain-containing protein [Deltaproteobacteria bacterium]